ncbi:MAG: ABC transporter ATP-binding protein, partial [Mangrovicoccus sp.]
MTHSTTQTDMAGISVRNVSKVYHNLTLPVVFGRPPKDAGFLAVDDVSFDVGKGESFGLVGPNGAGKTTLIKIICALLHPSSGSVKIEGLDTVTDADEVKKCVGLVTSNERSFYWRLTGQQNLEFFSAIYRIDIAEARAWIDMLMDFLDLEKYRHKRFDSYSTGTKQRFAIARGLLSKPKFLLLDEPTKGVDPVNAAAIIDLLANRLQEFWNPTILITSHNLREIELLCPRVGVMKSSRLVAEGTLEDLAKAANLTSLQQIKFTGAPDFSAAQLPDGLGVADLSIETDAE